MGDVPWVGVDTGTDVAAGGTAGEDGGSKELDEALLGGGHRSVVPSVTQFHSRGAQ